MDMGFLIFKSLVGTLKIEYIEDRITGIKKVTDMEPIRGGESFALLQIAKKQLEEYFAKKRTMFNFPMELKGTPFQKKVWKELCEIPYGETRSYKEIAIKIGNPLAARAVGMANNKNPIAIVVPCHRVIGMNGKLVGYAGGLAMKEYLLHLESEKTI